MSVSFPFRKLDSRLRGNDESVTGNATVEYMDSRLRGNDPTSDNTGIAFAHGFPPQFIPVKAGTGMTI